MVAESYSKFAIRFQERFLLLHWLGHVIAILPDILPIFILFEMNAGNEIEVTASVHSIHRSIYDKVQCGIANSKSTHNLKKQRSARIGFHSNNIGPHESLFENWDFCMGF